MATTIKILGQSAPSASTLTDLYTVPGGTQATISTITVCNRGTNVETFRISVAVGGAADDVKQYIYRDLSCYPADSFLATVGLTLGAGDVVRVFATSANFSFQLFGAETT